MKTSQQTINKSPRVTFLTFFLFAMCSLFSQTEQFYYYNGERIMLQEIEQKKYFLIKTEDTLSFKQSFSISGNRNLFFEKLYVPVIPYNNTLYTDYCWCITEINEQDCNLQNYVYKSSAYFTVRGDTVMLSHLLYVKLKKAEDIDLLESLADSLGFTIVGQNKFMRLWYTLSCTKHSVGNALQVANLLYESGLFAAAEPDFFGFMEIDCVNDTHASSQWGLNNTGQDGGIAGIDIGYCQAKEISQGNANIIVAIVDQGIELDHPDLGNIFPLSYDTELGVSPSIVWGEHGTACAGIIGATSNNNLGIAGIAPLSPLMSISNSLLNFPGSYIKRADGINFAWQNGASIISNSWHCSTLSSIIDEAIDNSLHLGRGGKGCVIVFASGNDSDSIVSYPSRLDGVLSVGAIDRCGSRAGRADSVPSSCDPWTGYSAGSNWGSRLSMVAPGTKIYTTDNQGDSGYNSLPYAQGNYYSGFCGTSAAAPHVAGVAALVLSVNPCLTREEVTFILESTCSKVRPDLYNYGNNPDHPNGTWNIEVGHGLVNAYEALLLAQSYLSPDTLTSATTWNEKKRIYADLIIDSLATLTVTDTLYIAGDHSIIVRPGGKLIVNGGTLTNACDGEMWQGIIVEGNANIRQTALAQGSVILNNATIENARDAICTMGSNPDSVFEHTGGIIQATNTLFRNNRRSVAFLSYENHTTGGAVTDNASYFTRCTFTVDSNNLFAQNGTSFNSHVTMWHVRGVKFNGCAFRNETANHGGKAIYTEEAGFTAKRVCPSASGPQDPCYCAGTATDTVTRCSFTGFHTAVHATNGHASYAVTLDNCDFSDNRTGVTLNAADNARVSFCDFDLSGSSSYCGVDLTNSTGYTIESDTLHSEPYSSSPSSIGIKVTHSGTAENVIRKNVMRNLMYGCMAQDTNATPPYVKPQYGLQFQCNDFLDCSYDIAVANGRIRSAQGSASAGADNTFRYAIQGSFLLSNAGSFTYWYSSTGYHAPYNTPTPGVTLKGTASANSCTSTLCGLTPLYPRDGLTALDQYLSMAEEYATIVETLRATSLQTDATDPQDDTDDADVIGRLSDLSAQMGDLARAEIRNILNDSVPDMALLKEWYQAITAAAPAAGDIPVSAYQLAEVYSEEGDLSAARTLLSALPQQFSPNEAARNEYANYMALQQLRETVAGNWYTMIDTDIAAMQQVAEYDNGRAARMAKEILCFFHHICYEDEMVWDLDGIGERALRGDGACPTATTNDGTLRLHPNPTGGTLTVETTSPIRTLTVYDLAGRVMMTAEGGANDYSPLRIMDVSSLPNGIYLLRAVTDNGVETGRFVKN